MSIEFNRGLQVAIDIINKEADALANDIGTIDPDTGALAVWDLETYNDLRELADKIEAHRAEIVDDEKPHPQTLAPNSVSIIGTMRAIAAAIKERKNK